MELYRDAALHSNLYKSLGYIPQVKGDEFALLYARQAERIHSKPWKVYTFGLAMYVIAFLLSL